MPTKRPIELLDFSLIVDWDGTEKEVHFIAFPEHGLFLGKMEFVGLKSGDTHAYAVFIAMLENGMPDIGGYQGEVEDWGTDGLREAAEKTFGVRFWG